MVGNRNSKDQFFNFLSFAELLLSSLVNAAIRQYCALFGAMQFIVLEVEREIKWRFYYCDTEDEFMKNIIPINPNSKEINL